MRAFLLSAALLLVCSHAHAQTADPLLAAADSYALYQEDVSARLDTNVTTRPALDLAIERAARHDPAALSRGWIAYGALTAAQSPAFVAGVRSRVHAASRAAVIRQLRRDLTYARRRPPGADEAMQLILNVNAADMTRMNAAAARFNALGQSLDAAAWAPPAETGDQRNARLRMLAHIERTPSPALAERLRSAPPLATSPPRRIGNQTLVDSMLTLAALYVVEATAQEHARVDQLTDDRATRECLTLEQLEFRQCASVAHEANDDAFCLARHGLPAHCFPQLAQ
jgi:hypothetical protein